MSRARITFTLDGSPREVYAALERIEAAVGVDESAHVFGATTVTVETELDDEVRAYLEREL
jgi:hypothetical protein